MTDTGIGTAKVQGGGQTGELDGSARSDMSEVLLPLLRGVVYRDDDRSTWNALAIMQNHVRDYVSVLFLDLVIDEAEGYAFLRSRRAENGEERVPRLVHRRQLSFPVSLLLALLRKRFVELDASGTDDRLILTRDEAAEMMRVFLPAGSNEARMVDRVEAHLNKIVSLGFARKLRSASAGGEQAFEIRRILKSFVDAEWLNEFDARLAEYQEHALRSASKHDAGQAIEEPELGRGASVDEELL